MFNGLPAAAIQDFRVSVGFRDVGRIEGKHAEYWTPPVPRSLQDEGLKTKDPEPFLLFTAINEKGKIFKSGEILAAGASLRRSSKAEEKGAQIKTGHN